MLNLLWWFSCFILVSKSNNTIRVFVFPHRFHALFNVLFVLHLHILRFDGKSLLLLFWYYWGSNIRHTNFLVSLVACNPQNFGECRNSIALLYWQSKAAWLLRFNVFPNMPSCGTAFVGFKFWIFLVYCLLYKEV